MQRYTRILMVVICGMTVAIAAGSSSAAIILGDSIGIDYGDAGGTVTNWNTKNTTASGNDESVLEFGNLVRTSDGAATGVSLSVDAATSLGVPSSTAGTEDAPAFFPTAVSADVAFITGRGVLTFTGLDDSLQYDITFLSSIGGDSDRPEVDWGWTTSAVQASNDPATWDTTVVFENLDAQFDHTAHTFTNLQSSGGVLRITMAADTFDAILLNGMQIDAVPEPATMSLIGLGGVMMLGRRRRRRR